MPDKVVGCGGASCCCCWQTILLLSMLRATVIMMGKGVPPTDAEMEQFSIRAYESAGHKQHHKPISRREFVAVSEQQTG